VLNSETKSSWVIKRKQISLSVQSYNQITAVLSLILLTIEWRLEIFSAASGNSHAKRNLAGM
jgi:hypothetical protein